MRIISKSKDYYDSARMGPGDPKRVYIRKTEEIKDFKFGIENRPCIRIPETRKFGKDHKDGYILFLG